MAKHPHALAWRPRAAVFLTAAAAAFPAAAENPCSEAMKAIDGVTTWSALQKTVRDYGHCDKGQTADFFTEALLRVYISGWPKVADAGPILEQDAAFKSWLTRRLSNPELSTQDTAEMRDLAKSSCPKGQDKVCGELLSAVEMGRALSAPDLLLLPAPTAAPAK